MYNTIPAHQVSPNEVSGSKCQTYFRPPSNIIGTIAQLKRKVPNYSVVGLHAFVGVLTYSGIISRLFGPVHSLLKIEFAADAILIRNLSTFNLTGNCHVHFSSCYFLILI